MIVTCQRPVSCPNIWYHRILQVSRLQDLYTVVTAYLNVSNHNLRVSSIRGSLHSEDVRTQSYHRPDEQAWHLIQNLHTRNARQRGRFEDGNLTSDTRTVHYLKLGNHTVTVPSDYVVSPPTVFVC